MTRRRPVDRGPRLFGAEQLRARPAVHRRLLALAGRAPRPATADEARRDEDLRAIDRLREQGRVLAGRHRLRPHVLEPERDGVVEHYGICYEDGLIRIRLRHATTGRLLKESSLVDTLCHELAHLRYLDHSSRFRRLYQRILDSARELGYYRPGPGESPGPRQLHLFDAGGCGNASRRRVAKESHGTAV